MTGTTVRGMRPPSLPHRTEGRPGRIRPLLSALWRGGVFERLIHARPRALTVLVYHRVADPVEAARTGFVENVSATPEAFAEQMRFMAAHFNVVPCRALLDWLVRGVPLPPRAALITFDDGYRDNHDAALPVLRALGLPATLFVATDCIGSARPFHWDLAAFCFARTGRMAADLPVLGTRSLDDEPARAQALRDWIAAMKELPDADRQEMVARLPAALGVTVPDDAFAGHHLTWEHVAEMAAAGVEIGAHTMSHPILGRLPPDAALREIAGSKRALEERLGRPVTVFAYPNGRPVDFGPEHEGMLRRCGFQAAFTTVAGPAGVDEARRAPLRIRRVGVIRRDTLAHFAAKVSGATLLADRLRAALPGGAVR